MKEARPKSYLLLDSIYMILWKRHASGDRREKKKKPGSVAAKAVGGRRADYKEQGVFLISVVVLAVKLWGPQTSGNPQQSEPHDVCATHLLDNMPAQGPGCPLRVGACQATPSQALPILVQPTATQSFLASPPL